MKYPFDSPEATALNKEIFENKTLNEAKNIKVTPKKIIVRSYKRRWGSCSHKKDISNNWHILGTGAYDFWKPYSNSGDIYYDGGKVGIGIGNPAAKLHVNGNIYVNTENYKNEIGYFTGASGAKGTSSTAIGYNCKASGDYSTAMGYQTLATADY